MVTAEKIERTALRNLIHNEDYTRKVLPFLKPEYFEDRNERIVFSEIQKFISQYNKRPTKETLQIDLGKRKDLNEDEYKQIVSSVKNSVQQSNQKLLEEVDKKLSSVGSNTISNKLLDRITKLEIAITQISDQVNSELKSNIHNINTEFANLNFRLNGLETKYIGLIKKLSLMTNSNYSKQNSSRYENDDDESFEQANDTSSVDNEPGSHNWVKVTKKHKGKTKYPSNY